MSDNKPTSLEQALIACALWGQGDWEHWDAKRMEHFIGSFKHSPNYHEAIAAIEGQIPAKINENAPMIGYKGDEEGRKLLKAWRRGRNEAIDTIHRNFTGQTDNEREDSRI